MNVEPDVSFGRRFGQLSGISWKIPSEFTPNVGTEAEGVVVTKEGADAQGHPDQVRGTLREAAGGNLVDVEETEGGSTIRVSTTVAFGLGGTTTVFLTKDDTAED
ncbi:hypothetical protein RvY_15480 [Ramazzottius varieornatus]|uniref:Uncharacterized protein n=1 Tax=Ramazzottius varieornatus TaxID=947166 RepID=A0A1D1VZQ1_RAMVA|nr:hypothetical protein RvY_15480 [Ramazzottius varieornatus]